MKFSLKLLLWTVVVLAVSLGTGGYYFVNYVFETSLNREAGQALDENSILQFAFETAALNVPSKYDVLQDSTVEQVASNLETGGRSSGRLLRICDENREPLYASDGFDADTALLSLTDETTRTYQVVHREKRYYVQTCTMINALDRILYLETMRDVTAVFKERELGFEVYRRVTVIMLILGTLIMHLIASWLTKPIRLLTRATRKMAAGDYDYRARQVSNDELGQLTMDFNKMAAALEENISSLEDEVKAREDFVAAFAHELKTPLTSIIGYADMLRSRKLDEEKSFLSANYIYTEGKRLEAMSFRLLDIIVTGRREPELRKVSVESLYRYLQDMFSNQEEMLFQMIYEDGAVLAEEKLILTVLVNLLDNACKASEPGGEILVEAKQTAGGFRFSVTDHGVGIPREEQHKITQAFYMVDKSRSRSRNGAGLGLSLCTQILALHGSHLEIESEPGKGSRISFVLPKAGQPEEDSQAGQSSPEPQGGRDNRRKGAGDRDE